MSFCPNCGSHLEDGAKFCPECGSSVGGSSYTERETSFYHEDTDAAAKTFSIVSLISGIVAVIGAPFANLFGLIFSIAGLIFSKLTRDRGNATEGDLARAKVGKILSIIALVVVLLKILLVVFLFIASFFSIGSIGEFNPSTDWFPFT